MQVFTEIFAQPFFTKNILNNRIRYKSDLSSARQILVHDQPYLEAVFTFLSQASEQWMVFSEVGSPMPARLASSIILALLTFMVTWALVMGRPQIFFCLAGCYAVLAGDDVVAVQALAVLCYFVYFKLGFFSEQTRLAFGQVAGYEVGVGASVQAHGYVGFAPDELAWLCWRAQYELDSGEPRARPTLFDSAILSLQHHDQRLCYRRPPQIVRACNQIYRWLHRVTNKQIQQC